ncbi:O-antigen polymerase [Litchfieldella anticariensis]|nr:O-antigen polymerase [Halomonas anticariensis]
MPRYRFYLSILIVLYFAAGAWVTFSSTMRPEIYFLLCLLMIVISIPFYYGSSSGDIFSPHSFIWISVFLGTSLKLYYVYANYNLDEVISFADGVSEAQLATALVFLTACGFFYVSGFLMAGNKYINLPEYEFSKIGSIPQKVYVFAFAILGIVASAYLYKVFNISLSDFASLSRKRNADDLEGGGGLVGIFRTLSQFCFYIAIILMMAYYKKNDIINRQKWLVVIALVFISSIFPFMISSRSLIVYNLITLMMLRHYFYKPLKFEEILKVVVPIVVVIGVMGGLRGFAHGQSEDLEFSIVDQFLSSIFLKHNMVDIYKISLMLEIFPREHPFLYGKTVFAWFFYLLPDWMVDNVVLRPGPFYGQVLFGLGENVRTGSPPSLFGEMYSNFGLALSLLSSFIYGVAIKIFYNTFVNNNNAVFSLIYMMCIIWVSFFLVGGDVSGTMLKIAVLSVTAIVLSVSYKRLGGIRFNL